MNSLLSFDTWEKNVVWVWFVLYFVIVYVNESHTPELAHSSLVHSHAFNVFFKVGF